MEYGYYADNKLPETIAHSQKYRDQYKLNSQGYRCREFSPLPNGGKNVAVLGCSHTFGEGLDDSEIWISQLEKLLNNTSLRFWNLAHPGASPDLCVRTLYGSEKVIFPKIIIVCWPVWSRRERLDKYPKSLTKDDSELLLETGHTDRNNFLKCVFQVEKFAEYNQAKVFHCFAQDVYDIPNNSNNVFNDTSLRLCWPEWSPDSQPNFAKNIHRRILTPSVARDGIHYGIEHHSTFAKKIYNRFKTKIK